MAHKSEHPFANVNHFQTIEDELEFYKSKAHHYYNEYLNIDTDSKEFELNSHAVEQELELQINQQEKTINDLRYRLNAQVTSNDKLKERQSVLTKDMEQIQRKYDDIVVNQDRLTAYIRELEQKNDDLERANRIVTETVASYESMLDQAYEKIGMLESEVDEKEGLKEKLQRLMDTMRDLQNEVNVKNASMTEDINASITSLISTGMKQTIRTPTTPSTPTNRRLIGSRLPVSSSIQRPEYRTPLTSSRTRSIFSLSTTPIPTANQPIKSDDMPDQICQNGNSSDADADPDRLTLSATTTALNIVRVMLRRVDTMEAKLRDCRELMPPRRSGNRESFDRLSDDLTKCTVALQTEPTTDDRKPSHSIDDIKCQN